MRFRVEAESPAIVLSVKQVGSTAHVDVGGELDMATRPELREALQALIHAGVADLILDCQALTYMDSTGISVLIGVYQATSAGGGSITLEHVPPSIQRILNVTGVDTLVSVS